MLVCLLDLDGLFPLSYMHNTYVHVSVDDTYVAEAAGLGAGGREEADLEALGQGGGQLGGVLFWFGRWEEGMWGCEYVSVEKGGWERGDVSLVHTFTHIRTQVTHIRLPVHTTPTSPNTHTHDSWLTSGSPSARTGKLPISIRSRRWRCKTSKMSSTCCCGLIIADFLKTGEKENTKRHGKNYSVRWAVCVCVATGLRETVEDAITIR